MLRMYGRMYPFAIDRAFKLLKRALIVNRGQFCHTIHAIINSLFANRHEHLYELKLTLISCHAHDSVNRVTKNMSTILNQPYGSKLSTAPMCYLAHIAEPHCEGSRQSALVYATRGMMMMIVRPDCVDARAAAGHVHAVRSCRGQCERSPVTIISIACEQPPYIAIYAIHHPRSHNRLYTAFVHLSFLVFRPACSGRIRARVVSLPPHIIHAFIHIIS